MRNIYPNLIINMRSRNEKKKRCIIDKSLSSCYLELDGDFFT